MKTKVGLVVGCVLGGIVLFAAGYLVGSNKGNEPTALFLSAATPIATAATSISEAPIMSPTLTPTPTPIPTPSPLKTSSPITELSKRFNVQFVHLSEPNSADGVDCRIGINNYYSDSIKYVTFTVQAYNAVNDPAEDEISGESIKKLRAVGPIEKSDELATYLFETVWYNSTIKHVKLIGVKVEYMNGDVFDITDESDIQKIWTPDMWS